MKPQASPPGVDARRAALRLLDAVLRRGLPLEAALDGAAGDLARPEDRGLAHAIAAETLRRLPDLDALIDSATQQRLPPDAKARFALRIALVQSLALGTPPHAAISTVLPLVDGGPRRLLHGVFGALMRRKVVLPSPPSLPRGVAERWLSAWGRDMVDAARAALAAPPPLDLSFADADASRAFDGEPLADRHARVPAQSRIAELPGFAEGDWWVQDLAASIPARLFGPGEGRTVLDLCAAPGGKTLQLASAGWQVTAVDSSAARLQRLRENLQRTRLSAEVIEADVMAWEPPAPVDAILLDAPCSATGIFRRHPDVLYRVRPKVIAEMAELQRAMLGCAAGWLKPGGKLVFSTCSLEPDEGESHLEHAPLTLDPVRADELPQGVAPRPNGHVRTLPTMLADRGALDGFFIARFRR
ncbi:RsmB/NOP family class I SAM-dependent RNA methyltransferase [Sphingomonas sp.]|uniref:RsmB/NOP family class I SAM-dependent RNA methyltransferase n=1 Tax=Sphingomonas sp. TaxID=28214 RepID=UPI002DBF3351|nr:RsmB/NOP family class I SAM-dependent RNA methyltransferase [Sphingomonas sp.]HEU4969870.1 RsmB/NOP family class I SAM-dependent RNA methyltransferase [Sphingomonas sp.]